MIVVIQLATMDKTVPQVRSCIVRDRYSLLESRAGPRKRYRSNQLVDCTFDGPVLSDR
jgi:hypothetical protein